MDTGRKIERLAKTESDSKVSEDRKRWKQKLRQR